MRYNTAIELFLIIFKFTGTIQVPLVPVQQGRGHDRYLYSGCLSTLCYIIRGVHILISESGI